MSESKRTVIICGVSSFVGSQLAEYLKKDFRVIGLYHKNHIRIPGVLTLSCDVLNRDMVQLIIFTFKPDFTIYVAGLSSVNDCHEQDKYADALNTVGVFNMTEFSERYRSRMVYISSSYIFSGKNKARFENDIPDPSTVLGKTKAAAEFYIQKSCLNYLVFRCCLFYGRGAIARQITNFELLEDNLSEGKNSQMDVNIKNGFLDVSYLGLILKICFEQDVANRLLHVSSRDQASWYDFAIKYCEIFGYKKELITKSNWNFPKLITPMSDENLRELNFNLNVGNIETFLNIEMPSIEESLKLTYHRFGGANKSIKAKKTSGIQYI